MWTTKTKKFKKKSGDYIVHCSNDNVVSLKFTTSLMQFPFGFYEKWFYFVVVVVPRKKIVQIDWFLFYMHKMFCYVHLVAWNILECLLHRPSVMFTCACNRKNNKIGMEIIYCVSEIHMWRATFSSFSSYVSRRKSVSIIKLQLEWKIFFSFFCS